VVLTREVMIVRHFKHGQKALESVTSVIEMARVVASFASFGLTRTTPRAWLVRIE